MTLGFVIPTIVNIILRCFIGLMARSQKRLRESLSEEHRISLREARYEAAKKEREAIYKGIENTSHEPILNRREKVLLNAILMAVLHLNPDKMPERVNRDLSEHESE